ncbi:unnamed protein product [Gordionus sp. m RMFG-2023]
MIGIIIATIANNLECYLKIQNIKFEKTQKGNHLIIYLGYEYLIKSANKKFIHLSCRDNCSAKCKYNTHLSLPSTQSQDSVILPDILISSNGIPHLEPQVSPIVPDISISSNGIPHLEPQVSPIVPDTNLDSPLDIAQALLDLNSNIYEYKCIFDGAYIASGIHDHPFEIGTFEMLKTKEALENIVAQNLFETRLNIYQQTMDKRCLEDPEIENYSEAIPSFISLRSHIDSL